MSIEDYAAQVARTLNQAGAVASDLELPANVADRYRIAWALLRLTFDHAASIASNFHYHGRELAGSPFALMRPMNEALKRGTWFAFCATDEQTQDFIRRDIVPRRDLAADIEQHPPFNQFPVFSRQYANAWGKFHSFTHGGAQVVGAYTMGGEIGPAFPDRDIYSVIEHAEAIAVMAVHVMCMIAGEFHPETTRAALTRLEGVEPAARPDA